MKRIAQAISFISLAATLLPAILFFADQLSLGAAQTWMLGSSILWFLTAPIWMEHKTSD